MNREGLQLDPRTRKGGVTTYVRGRLVPELLGLLRELHPRIDFGRVVNLRRHFGITCKAAAERWLVEHHRLLMARRSGQPVVLDLVRSVEAYEVHLRHVRERPYAASTIAGRMTAARRIRDKLGPDRLTTTIRSHELASALAAAGAGARTTHSRIAARNRTRAFLVWLLNAQAIPLVTFEDLRRALRPPEGGLAPRVPPRWLRPDEIASLLTACDEAPRGDFARILLLTGARLHELLELRWERAGPESGFVDLPGRLVHYWSRKTRSFHLWRLAWSPTVEDWLHDQPREHPLVFGGAKVSTVDYLLRATKRVEGRTQHPPGPLREAVPGVRWKDLRSTAATYLHCAHGVPGGVLEKAQAIGHRVSTAETSYVNAGCVVPPVASTLEEAMGLAPIPNESGGRVIRLA